MSPRTYDSSPQDGAQLAPPPSTLAPRAARHATKDGTRRFVERSAHGPEFRRKLPRELSVSALGVGTYLGDCTDEDDVAYVQAIRAAIASGVNVIDTAINYRCQRSERAVGRAVAESIDAGEAARDALVVCTKGGYVAFDGAPPESREEYDAWLERELFATGIVAREELVRGGHCITPRFLARQLERSRKNLGLEAIDLYYIHNPEEQLLAAPAQTWEDAAEKARYLLSLFASSLAASAATDADCEGSRRFHPAMLRNKPGQSDLGEGCGISVRACCGIPSTSLHSSLSVPASERKAFGLSSLKIFRTIGRPTGPPYSRAGWVGRKDQS